MNETTNRKASISCPLFALGAIIGATFFTRALIAGPEEMQEMNRSLGLLAAIASAAAMFTAARRARVTALALAGVSGFTSALAFYLAAFFVTEITRSRTWSHWLMIALSFVVFIFVAGALDMLLTEYKTFPGKAALNRAFKRGQGEPGAS